MARPIGNVQALTAALVMPGAFKATETLTGNRVLTLADGQFLNLDPGGSARDVTLPAARDGLFYFIANRADGAENLVVKNADGLTVVTLNQNDAALVACDGTSWVFFGVITIAQS